MPNLQHVIPTMRPVVTVERRPRPTDQGGTFYTALCATGHCSWAHHTDSHDDAHDEADRHRADHRIAHTNQTGDPS